MAEEEQPELLEGLLERLTALVESEDGARAREALLQSAADAVGAQTGALYRVDLEAEVVRFDVALGSAGALLKHAVTLKPGEGLAGHAALTRQAEIVNDVPSDPRHARQIGLMAGVTVTSAVTVPLLFAGRVVGVLQLLNKQSPEGPLPFDRRDLELLEALAIPLGLALEIARLESVVERNMSEVTETIGAMVDLKDGSTGMHSTRVAALVRAIAARMKLPPAEIAILNVAALLHDVGKIGLPDSLLVRDKRYTPEERKAVEVHSAIGAELISRVSALAPCVPIIRAHHERLDGKGYPDGLSGTEIPLGARILAAASAFEVIVNQDSYAEHRSPTDAIDELRRNAGTQFDPRVVEALDAALQAGELRRIL